MNARLLIAGLLLAGAATPVPAQVPRTIVTTNLAPPLSPADNAAYLEAARLEAGGQAARAIEALWPLVLKSPAEPRFLALLERSLVAVDKRREMLPFLASALARDSMAPGVLGVAVRVHAGLRQADSARKYAERWFALAPASPVPFREWSNVASEVGDLPGAMTALQAGRRAMASGTALAAEIANAHQELHQYADAIREWLVAIGQAPRYRTGALLLLGSTPASEHADILRALEQAGTADARALRGLLTIQWGKVTEGVALVRSVIPADPLAATDLLQDLLTELRGNDDDRAVLAGRGQAFEALAALQRGTSAVDSRLEAARAYADAGRESDARRLLTLVAADRNAPPGIASSATGTLLGVLIAEGRAIDAETTLARIRPSLGEEEYESHRRRLVLLWMRQGHPDRAEALVHGDSTVGGIDLLGRIRLYAGDLAGATEALRYAGPFDEVRTQSVSRIVILALLQAIGEERSPPLGAAFLALESGDSATALRLVDSLAATARPAGAAELRLLAGRLALARGDRARAQAFFQAADVPAFPGTAAAARLESARLLAAAGQRDAARLLVERLILDFPDSALLPDARRLRDEVRGAVPAGTS